MSATAISVKNLKKSYGKVRVLDGVNFEVKKGSILALLGPNGAGKTTTVKVLSTLLQPDSGKATVNGFDVVEHPDGVRSTIGLTGQYAAVDELLTGRENLLMIGRLYHLSRSDTKVRAEVLLKRFDLVDAADRAVKTYSGGMRRRLDLAASLIASPPIIFLDEPTTGLDPRSRLAMWDIIQDLVKGGTTILLTTQYLEEADLLADNIIVIDGGKVIAEGTADQLKAKVGKERIELQFARNQNLEKILALMNEKSATADETNHSISIPNDGGVKKLRQVLETLETKKIKVESLSLHKPTLDDVFLKLTGHQVSQQDEEAEKGKKR